MKLFSSKKKEETPPEKENRGLFSRLTRTREGLFGGILGLFKSGELDAELLEQIEDQLLVADLGVSVSQKIIDRLRTEASSGRLSTPDEVRTVLRGVMIELITPCEKPDLMLNAERPTVILMVGVNGVGKTTTLAKLAARYKNSGRSVMLAACDTFRAAAIEQLQTWGQRLDIPVISQSHGSDAAAVAYDAYSAAAARESEILLVDTAGRQHTHGDLVEQLKKVKRVMTKANPEVPDEVWLTVDAGNGQNVLSQVAHFDEAVQLTGLCITKLDGTAKGGIVFALADRFGLPVRFIGVGEGEADLRPFVAEEFVDALLPELGNSD